MESRDISVQQGTSLAPVLQPAEDFRLNHAGLWTPDVAGNRNVRSGILPGPKASDGNTPLSVIATPATSASVTIKAGHFTIQGSTALSGAYTGTVDSDKVRAIAPLPSSGNFKAGRVVIHIYDQVYGDSQDGWDIEILLGTQASSAGAAALPSIPSTGTYLELREFTINSAGSVSFAGPTPNLTVPRGGILPVQSTDTTNGSYVGQYRDHPTLGLQRWNGTSWDTILADSGETSFTPPAPIILGGGGAFYRKVGKVVTLGIDSKYSGSYVNNFVYTTLPVGYRPSRSIYVQGVPYGATTTAVPHSIDPDGTVRTAAAGTFTGMLVNFTFLVP